MMHSRRQFLRASCALLARAGIASAFGYGAMAEAKPTLFNPCLSLLPLSLIKHTYVVSAWAGIEPSQVWDCHVHLVGTGDGNSGIYVSPEMQSWLHPVQNIQRYFYMNAACAEENRVDTSVIERLITLNSTMIHSAVGTGGHNIGGCKIMLMAFEHFHDKSGKAIPAKSAFYVPNAWVQKTAMRYPHACEWICSIHPYREDALYALRLAVKEGARAVKWLPSAMGIDPSSPNCDAFFALMHELNLPLITHAGEEQAVSGAGLEKLNNPLLLRRALDHGVRVVIAHCATIGEDIDIDQGQKSQRRLPSFELFSRLMNEPRYERYLYGDISALTLRNRDLAIIKKLLDKQDWHARLLNGSDYPLPGVLPLISPSRFAAVGLLPEDSVDVLDKLQLYNPLLFDFVLKRNLQNDGHKLATSIFHTRRFFQGK